MRKIKHWIRNKLISLLKIDEIKEEVKELNRLYTNLVSIGVDIHFREPTTIIIISKLKGGQVRHIPTEITSIRELNNLTAALRHQYRTNRVIWDKPPRRLLK